MPAPALGALYLEAQLGSRVRVGQCLARILAEPGHADGEVKVLAPVDGLLHPTNVLDSRGGDAPEKLCKTTR